MDGSGSGLGLSAEQEATLASVLDEIIPESADGTRPGAGEAGLVRTIGERAPELGPFLADGLAALDALARGRGAAGFRALARPERIEVLNEYASGNPGFLPGLIFQVYAGYYQVDQVVAALGLEPRPPHPEGYPLESGDLSLLAPVRRRGRLYREP